MYVCMCKYIYIYIYAHDMTWRDVAWREVTWPDMAWQCATPCHHHRDRAASPRALKDDILSMSLSPSLCIYIYIYTHLYLYLSLHMYIYIYIVCPAPGRRGCPDKLGLSRGLLYRGPLLHVGVRPSSTSSCVVVVVVVGITVCEDLCVSLRILHVLKQQITSPTRGARLLEICVSPKQNTTFQNMLPV